MLTLSILAALIITVFYVVNNTSSTDKLTANPNDTLSILRNAEKNGDKVEWLECGYNGEWIAYRGSVDMGGRLFPEQKLYQNKHKVRATLWAKDNNLILV